MLTCWEQPSDTGFSNIALQVLVLAFWLYHYATVLDSVLLALPNIAEEPWNKIRFYVLHHNSLTQSPKQVVKQME